MKLFKPPVPMPPKLLVPEIPVTAKGVVDLVVTNYGLFEITQEGMALKEIAPGISVDEVKATTGCNLIVPREVPPVRLRG